MKLMKKVLPLASIAALGAIIAPIVTSCSTASFVDVLQYKPTQKAYDDQKKEFTQEEALDLYFGDINNNKAILQDDIFYGISKGLPSSHLIKHDYQLVYKNLNLRMTDIVINKAQCRASFKIETQIVAIPNHSDKDDQNLTIYSTLAFNNVSFWMDPKEEGKPQCFSIYGDDQDFAWSIQVAEDVTFKFNDFNHHAANNGIIDASSFHTAFQTFYTLEIFGTDNIKTETNEIWMMFESNYLKNIKVNAPVM